MTLKKKYLEKGTIHLKSFAELNEVVDEFKGKLISPGGAAARLGVSRSYIYQLEKAGRIRAFRLETEAVDKGKLPVIFRLLLSGSKMPKEEYIYIPLVDLDEIKKERERKELEAKDEEIKNRKRLLELFEKEWGPIEGFDKDNEEMWKKIKKVIEEHADIAKKDKKKSRKP